jgi:protein tyrosine phosphatase (PTP) superfamily phosphohydrolase (DUF442 family)
MKEQIINFYQYSENLAAGGQPTAGQLKALKEDGFEAVFNISPASTRNYLADEAETVEKLNMDYVHFPIDCSNLKDSHYAVFSNVVKLFEGKKLFIHCGGNIKSSNLLHIYFVLEKGRDEAESIQELKKIQTPEAKWFSYFQKLGMAGIN